MELTESYEVAWNPISTTKLGLACFEGKQEIIEKALTDGIIWAEESIHPLHAALYARDGKLIKKLLDAGSPVDELSLYLAYRFSGNGDEFNLLSDPKYNVHLSSTYSNNILMDAARVGDVAGVIFALAKGADVDALDYWYGDNNEGSTALHHAAQLLNKQLMEVLVGAKADVNKKNKAGNTPLKLCARIRPNILQVTRKECVQFLLAHGAEYGEPLSFFSKFKLEQGMGLYI